MAQYENYNDQIMALEAIMEMYVSSDTHPQAVSSLQGTWEASGEILESDVISYLKHEARVQAIRDASKTLPHSWPSEVREYVSEHLATTADDLDIEAQWKELTGEQP